MVWICRQLPISIHPMLRFNGVTNIGAYLSAYNFNTSYVTVQLVVFLLAIPVCFNFNTSYVTVQQSIFGICTALLKISIHPMLRFNSTHLNNLKLKNQYFNTSYVTVQQI